MVPAVHVEPVNIELAEVEVEIAARPIVGFLHLQSRVVSLGSDAGEFLKRLSVQVEGSEADVGVVVGTGGPAA